MAASVAGVAAMAVSISVLIVTTAVSADGAVANVIPRLWLRLLLSLLWLL